MAVDIDLTIPPGHISRQGKHLQRLVLRGIDTVPVLNREFLGEKPDVTESHLTEHARPGKDHPRFDVFLPDYFRQGFHYVITRPQSNGDHPAQRPLGHSGLL